MQILIHIYKYNFRLFLQLCLAGFANFSIAQPASPFVSEDSVRSAASLKYDDAGLMKQIFLGKNYRKTWSTYVTLPVFDMKASGFRIQELAGGQQTKSLELIAIDSSEWVLRTVDKNVQKAVPPKLRNKFVVSIVQDMVSAAFPYAPLIIPVLAKATGVTAADPVFYFIPDDPAFGEHQHVFANTVCMLERKKVLPGTPSTLDTGELIDELVKGESKMDQKAYLRARLLDMLIADWDRHQDQWKWAEKFIGNEKYIYPLPRDRDQAMFNSHGLLVKMSRIFGLRHFTGFRENTSRIRNLNSKSWNLDKLLLNELTASDWRSEAESFTRNLNDATINLAVRKLPPEIYELQGENITQKLISRRNTLVKNVMNYYEFINKTVTVYGSDHSETYQINASSDSLQIIMRRNSGDETVHYSRAFRPGETSAIKIISLGGNDKFTVNGKIPGNIKLEIDAGPGNNMLPQKTFTTLNNATGSKDFLLALRTQLKITEE